MKLLIVLATAILVVQSIDIDEQWQKFKVTQHKLYKSLVEDKVRYNIFKDNVNTIEEHNKRYEEGLESYKMGINQFTDMTQEEFMNLLKTSGNKPKIPEVIEKVLIEDHSKSVRGVQVDWRKKGAVTGVKNQGQCGSCWSFSTIGSLEGAYFFKHKKLLSFSEQCLVDCSTANHGCSGGWMTTAFNYIFQHGITTENKYPYKAKQGKCSYHDNQSVTKISKIGVIKKNSEPVLQYATAKYGPISVAIDASKFQHYSSGIINDKSCSSTKLNHGVLVVGYGNENGLDYWIVKNSWGNNWGEKGYVRMARNKNNQCGIAAAACFPFL